MAIRDTRTGYDYIYTVRIRARARAPRRPRAARGAGRDCRSRMYSSHCTLPSPDSASGAKQTLTVTRAQYNDNKLTVTLTLTYNNNTYGAHDCQSLSVKCCLPESQLSPTSTHSPAQAQCHMYTHACGSKQAKQGEIDPGDLSRSSHLAS